MQGSRTRGRNRCWIARGRGPKGGATTNVSKRAEGRCAGGTRRARERYPSVIQYDQHSCRYTSRSSTTITSAKRFFFSAHQTSPVDAISLTRYETLFNRFCLSAKFYLAKVSSSRKTDVTSSQNFIRICQTFAAVRGNSADYQEPAYPKSNSSRDRRAR